MSGARHRLAVGDLVLDLDLVLAGDALTGTLKGDGGDRVVEARVERAGPHRVRVRTADGVCVATVVRDGNVRYVAIDGDVFVVKDAAADRAVDATAEKAPSATSPMTGVVVKVSVTPGDAAAEGDPLFAVEAMKMEYVVRAPRDVVIEGVHAEAGQAVELGDVLATFVADEA